ncbi:MAG: archaellin/type IV pilin N-terminal domain-containing protein [Thermoplasmata archaeon]
MNIWGKKERSWRRKNGRGVSPIIATILLVAITVVLAAVLYILIQQYTKSGNNVTIGSALAIGGSTDGTGPTTTNFYNMTVESVSTTLTLGSFTFEVKSPTGSILAVGSVIGGVTIATLKVVVVNPINTVVATFTPGAATTFGAGCVAPTYTTACSTASAMTTQYTFSVQVTSAAAPAPSLSGCTLVALGQGSFSGTTSGTIT